MHTSTRLVSQDFSYSYQGAEGVPFDTIFPDYHEQDRIGVVSLGLEEGVYHTSFALLAFTTAFYDRLRARQSSFFDYPQHFAFVGAQAPSAEQSSAHHGAANQYSAANQNSAANITTIHVGSDLLPADTPQLWNAWSWLDVWPANKWLTAPPTVEAMIQRVFDYQINRLFWPRSLAVQGQSFNRQEHAEYSMKSGAMQNNGMQDAQPPSYLWKMLRSSLKAVYLYGPPAPTTPSPWTGLAGEEIEVRGHAAAQEIVQESLVQLPAPLLMKGTVETAQLTHTPQRYTSVEVTDFLERLENAIMPQVA